MAAFVHVLFIIDDVPIEVINDCIEQAPKYDSSLGYPEFWVAQSTDVNDIPWEGTEHISTLRNPFSDMDLRALAAWMRQVPPLVDDQAKVGYRYFAVLDKQSPEDNKLLIADARYEHEKEEGVPHFRHPFIGSGGTIQGLSMSRYLLKDARELTERGDFPVLEEFPSQKNPSK